MKLKPEHAENGGSQLLPLSQNGRNLAASLALILAPSKRQTPDQWAAENRIYPKSAGMPGPRDPWLTPYKVPFAQAVASGRYKRVVDASGAQMGKSENLLDIIGHRLDTKPAPILYVGPNKQFLTEQFEPRVMQLLDEAPVLKGKVVRGKKMTKTRKVVAGVPLRLAHAGSSTALKSDPAALAIIDEYDEMMGAVQKQGDPLGLVEARGDTYADFVMAVTSTPSLGTTEVERDPKSGLEFWKFVPGEDIQSPIWNLWQRGTRHHFAWCCPHCRQWFIPRFALLRWPKGASAPQAKAEAYLTCGHDDCGGIIEEHHKAEMNKTGQMIAPGQWFDEQGNVCGDPIDDGETISFWTSGLCTPFKTFGDRAEAYINAVRSADPEKVRTVINAAFGELYSPGGGDVPEIAEVHRLKVPYQMGQVPAGVVCLTAGVDVQKNRLVFVVRGWGARGTSWLITQGELWGPTAEPEVWVALEDLLENDISGLRIRMAIIDSGFRPNKPERGSESIVYDFCRRHQRNTRPSKGYETLAAGALTLSKLEIDPGHGKAKYGLELVRINSDWCKLWVHERIRWPQDQPGAFFIPEDVSDDYCQQLLSEARVKNKLGRPQWIRRSRDNHFLDCEAMAYAAGYMLNVHRIGGREDGSFRERVRDVDGAIQTAKPNAVDLRADKPSGDVQKPIVKRPKVIRSNFLMR
jgi:phage terminase large subunit GpA-like protein